MSSAERTPSRRSRRIAGAVACLASVPLLFAAVNPANATNGTRGPGPAPACTAGSVKWQGSIELARGGNRRAALPGISFGPGNVDVLELVTWDGYAGRSATDPNTQRIEQVRLEFFKDGQWVGTSVTSEDLEDGVESFWWAGNLGRVSLPNGADRVEVVHSSAFEDDGQPNGMSVTGVCMQFAASGPALSAAIQGSCEDSYVVSVTNAGDRRRHRSSKRQR